MAMQRLTGKGVCLRKKTIGDIDLILKNNEGSHLLIEAKNHALPLAVYFKDSDKTLAHLEYLQNEWEKRSSAEWPTCRSAMINMKFQVILYLSPYLDFLRWWLTFQIF